MAEKEYERLTGARLRRSGFVTAFATRSSLWLGKDHLLAIDSTGYTETYKRFYFRDIQAFTLRQTQRRMWWNVALIPLAVGFVTLLITTAPQTSPSSWTANEIAGGSVLAGIALLFVFLALLNTLRGPACTCHLRTAVQSEDVPSLNRLKRAHRILGRLRPLLEAAQGRLAPEEIQLRLAQASVPEAPPRIGRVLVPSAQPIRPYKGKAHLILFCLLLTDLPLTTLHFFSQSPWQTILNLLWMLTTVALAITAIVQQNHTDLPISLRRIPWITLATEAFFFITSIGYGVYIALNNPSVAREKLSPMEDPIVLAMTIVSTASSLVLGVIGLVLLRKFRAQALQTLPAPAVTPDAPP